MRRKISALAFSVVLSAGCSSDSITPPAPSAPTAPATPATPAPQSNGPFTISLSTPPGHPAFVEDDTVTVTARVVDKDSVTVSAPTLKWFGPVSSESKSTNATFVLKAGDNFLGVLLVQNGVAIASANVHLSAVGRPGEMIIWNPEGGVVRIAAPSGAWRISPVAMNDLGDIIGTIGYTDEGDAHGFVWSASTGFTELKTPDGRPAVPTAINNSGVIAGNTFDGSQRVRPFTWSRSAGLTAIPDTELLSAIVTSINAHGHLAGRRFSKPFLWGRETGFVGYPGAGDTPPGYDRNYSTAVALNDNDDMLASWDGGLRDDYPYDAERFYYNYPIYDYPTIWSGVQKYDVQCRDCVFGDMNNRREIAGIIYLPSYRAIRWTAKGGVTLLPIGAYDRSVGRAINESGNVVGFVSSTSRLTVGLVSIPPGVRRAAAWGSSELVVLDPPTGIISTEARDINNAGLVLVYAR